MFIDCHGFTKIQKITLVLSGTPENYFRVNSNYLNKLPNDCCLLVYTEIGLTTCLMAYKSHDISESSFYKQSTRSCYLYGSKMHNPISTSMVVDMMYYEPSGKLNGRK